MENEVQPTCAGLTLHPGTPKEEHVTMLEAKRRGIRVEDPNLQRLIDAAVEG